MTIEEAYDTYVDTVYKFFYIQSFDRETAEDLTSQTFLAYAERAAGQGEISDTKKYIYGIMRKVWMMYLREKYRRAEVSIEEIENIEAYVERTITDYSGASLRERAMPYIDRLPSQQQQIVRMRLIDEISIKDIAKEIGKDSNYVKTTYKRGVHNIRRMLEQLGGREEVV